MGTLYADTYHVAYDGLKPDLTICPYTLFDYFQKTAIRHSDSIGYKLDWFEKEKKGFVLTDWHVIIHRLPSCYETVTLHTWPNITKNALFERSFEMRDEKGRPIVKALSRWVFLDISTRRISRIEPDMKELYHLDKEKALPGETYKFPDYSSFTAQSQRKFTVTRRDTDTNFHVNNVKYVEWAMDDIPDDIFYHQNPVEMRISYKKECARGNSVQASFLQKENAGEFVSVFQGQGEQNPYALIWSRWQ